VLDFPPEGAEILFVISGAVARDVKLEDADAWCPAVHASWIPFAEFGAVAKDAAFRGPTPVWARNRGDIDFDADIRVRLGEGQILAPPDLTAPYYASRAWRETFYRGVQTLKAPTDLWIMQEILHELKPDVVIETGTFSGGSALYFADILDRIHGETITTGHVASIDIDKRERPSHARVSYFAGSSTDPAVFAEARDLVESGDVVLVVLDSDHSTPHVADELRLYAPLVSPGSYLVVEDTNTPGPACAVEAFLASPEGKLFSQDRSREKLGLTFNPGGWLKKGHSQ